MKTNKGMMILCIVLAVCLVAAVGAYAAINTAYQDAQSPVESPYVVPDKYNMSVRYPDLDSEQADMQQLWNVVYSEQWSLGDRASWLLRNYNIVYYGQYLLNNEEFFKDEEILREVAWFEAELELLDSLQNSILEELGIDREAYLVYK